MKPEEFTLSVLEMYGNKEIFEKRLKEGYTEISFGAGQLVGDKRIVRLWVFYHPDGEIATYEHPKSDDGSHTFRGQPFEAEYNTKKTLIGKLFGINSFKNSFEEYLKKFKITLDKRKSLAQVVESWED